MTQSNWPPDRLPGWGLGVKLTTLLLAFGVLPLTVANTVGYLASREVVRAQGRQALETVTAAQAVHLGMELNRQRLILRTIAGQLPARDRLTRLSPGELGRRLEAGLPEGGVFDGLRVVAGDGAVLGVVALRHRAPHWPAAASAGNWAGVPVAVHRDPTAVLAYLLAVPLGPDSLGPWLEGHVRQEDFRRVFSLPVHLLSQAEFAILDGSGEPVLVGHSHAGGDLAALARGRPANTVVVVDTVSPTGATLLALAPVSNTDWRLAVGLPLSVVLSPLAQLRNLAAVSTTALVLLIMVTGWYAARSVTTPLRQLADAAHQFGRVGARRFPPVRARGETGMLVEAFNAMAEDLDRSRMELGVLHARELERAQQLATVGELASGVAHEIRNPLTGVAGALDLALRRLAPDDHSRALLEEAQQQLRRIDGATAQLLQYARPPELRQIAVDANMLMERAATLVGPQASRQRVRLRAEPAPAPVRVHVDSELIVQVLVNLILNAIDAVSADQEVTVWVARHSPEVWLGVRDTGPGIPPAMRHTIFRPFFTTKHQGTGLGLSISQQIVSRHGGTLRLEETPGGGATFVVALPLLTTDGEADGRRAP